MSSSVRKKVINDMFSVTFLTDLIYIIYRVNILNVSSFSLSTR